LLSDVTDFIEFGTSELQEIDEIGEPIFDDEGNTITYMVSHMNFRNHDEVDGTLITEVKKGKDGVSIKLADKMKALDMLTKYFDLLSEKDKKQLQEEKLKLDIENTKVDSLVITIMVQ